MSKRKTKTEPVPQNGGLVKMSVNGHSLEGGKWNGKWSWACPSWPDLAAEHEGDTSPGPMVGEFTSRALAGCLNVQEFVRETQE